MTTEKFYPERFTVDTLGMRQLHQQRQPEQLVKELVQNVFDEKEASNCEVTIQREEAGARVIVEDDGLGFSNVSDAYTLMGDTAKRMDPERRGRFNMGEKEVLCVATWATVETVGSTVEFPEGRGPAGQAEPAPEGNESHRDDALGGRGDRNGSSNA